MISERSSTANILGVITTVFYISNTDIAESQSVQGTINITKEYCEREHFVAECPSQHVILMTSAIYGRMKLGRCVRVDYGALGCQTNVLRLVDSLCSGRRECSFQTSLLHSTRPCISELVAYLEATYICIKVESCQSIQCDEGGYIRLRDRQGYLSSDTMTHSDCDVSVCPWVLHLDQGQRINITYYNFVSTNRTTAQGSYCHRMATVTERESLVSKDLTLCGSEPRLMNLLVEDSKEVEIRIFKALSSDSAAAFLLQYKEERQPTWNLHTAIDRANTTEGMLAVVGVGVVLGAVLGFSLLVLAVFIIKRKRFAKYQRAATLSAHSSRIDYQQNPSNIYNRSALGPDKPLTLDDNFCRTYQCCSEELLDLHRTRTSRLTDMTSPCISTQFNTITSNR